MKKNLRKIFELILIFVIIALSVTIFIFRDKLQNIGSVGYLGLFLLCLLANSTVLLPAPSLIIAASCALILNPILVALVASLGSTVGELVGYLFGAVTKDLSPKFQSFLEKLSQKVKNRTVLVFILALLPLPFFDVAGVYSGGTKLNLLNFLIACFIGKFVKTLFYTKVYDILAWAEGMIPFK